MTDRLIELLAKAGANAVIRIEVWPNGIGNDPPPEEFNRPASTVHVDPYDGDVPPPPRPTTILYVPVGKGAKNIRSAPGLDTEIVATAPEKTAITIYTDKYTRLPNDPNKFTWREIASPYAGKYVAEEVLTATKPNPNPPPDAGGQKIGIHYAQGSIDHNATLAMLRRLHAAGTPVPVMMVLGTAGNLSVKAIKAASPLTKVIYRIIDGGNYNCKPDRPYTQLTYEYGRAFTRRLWNIYIAPNDDIRAADYISLYNEWDNPDAACDAVNEFTRGMMDEAHALGFCVTLYNFNPGFPPYPTESKPQANFWVRQATLNNLRQAIAQNHVVAWHGYDLFGAGNWIGADDCLRHENIWKLLPSDIRASLQLYLTEFGDALLLDVDDATFLRRCREAQAKLKKTAYVKGVCLWTLGISSEVWRESNWVNHISVYEGFLKNG